MVNVLEPIEEPTPQYEVDDDVPHVPTYASAVEVWSLTRGTKEGP